METKPLEETPLKGKWPNTWASRQRRPQKYRVKLAISPGLLARLVFLFRWVFPTIFLLVYGPCQVAEVELCFAKQTTSNKLCLTKEKDTHTLLIC